jgi:antirestriction protein ArdC
VNVLLLWGDAISKGFSSSTWMTYKQAQELGGQVRKGECGSLVVFADSITTTEDNGKGEEVERRIPFMKGYTVFNIEQIDGLPALYGQEPSPALAPLALHQGAEEFFAKTGATFRHGGNQACYSPASDVIRLPPPAAFRDPESYAATKAHELIHWTGHVSRCTRELGKRFGGRAYAFEELIAELGAAFLCADLGITPEIREDHGAYLAHWLAVLKEDKRAIFTAATHAQRAADFLQGLQDIATRTAA